MWKSFCKWLRITVSLFTVYHSEINDQSKWANQDVECKLRIYYNYMQNNQAKWLSMIKFSENFNIFLIILMISFYFNKNFHSWMSFNSNIIFFWFLLDSTLIMSLCEILYIVASAVLA